MQLIGKFRYVFSLHLVLENWTMLVQHGAASEMGACESFPLTVRLPQC